jgi:hypothetical protein
MAVFEKVYKGDVGTAIVLDTKSDLTGVVSKSISVRKPDGSTVSWEASVVELNGVLSGLRHVTVSGDLDQDGVYKLQAVVELSYWQGRGETTELKVWEVFE